MPLTAKTFEKVRGLKNNCDFVAPKKKLGVEHPELSLWFGGLKETLEQFPAFMLLAREMGFQSLPSTAVLFDDDRAGNGLAGAERPLIGARDRASADHSSKGHAA